NGFAYIATDIAGVVIIDVSDPANPLFRSNYLTSLDCKDLVASGDYVYAASSWTGLVVINVANPDDPYLETTLDLNGSAAHYIDSQNDYLYVLGNGIGDRNLYIVDITTPSNPVIYGSFPGYPKACDVSGEYAYQCDILLGFQSLDISDTTNIREVSTLKLLNPTDVMVEDNYAYVSDSGDLIKVIQLW
ncbi:unnamed protein product, partial [marine sediment metagenome]